MGIADTIYPKRPGQIECDVSKHLSYVPDLSDFYSQYVFGMVCTCHIYLLNHLVLNYKMQGAKGSIEDLFV